MTQIKFLVIRGANIGDLICTTPLITTLRKSYPNARIDALVNSYNAPVIENNPDVDHVFFYTKAKHRKRGETVLGVHWRRLKLIYKLRRLQYDYILLANCGYLHRPLRLARMLNPKHVIGYVPEGLNDRIVDMPVVESSVDSHRHEVIRIQNLLKPLGILSEPPRLTLVPNKTARLNAEANVTHFFGQTPLPIIAVHISARLPSQRWPAESFAQLIQKMSQSQQYRFMLFWSPGDENNAHHPGDDQKAQSILKACAGLPILPYPTLKLDDLIAGLSVCDAMFCADGGAMHIGAALGLSIVCLFGESPANNWYPWGVPHQVIQADSRRVVDISVDEACNALQKIMANIVVKA